MERDRLKWAIVVVWLGLGVSLGVVLSADPVRWMLAVWIWVVFMAWTVVGLRVWGLLR
jgi:hypothetical protein